MYNKFSCYKSGEIDRKINSLKLLDSTYFTVEQIKGTLGGSRFRKVNDNLNMSPKDFYKEQREFEEKELSKAVEIIQNILDKDNLNFEYKQVNNKTYFVVSINKGITEVEKSLISGQLDDNIYHIEIDNNSDGRNIIEIHLKNIYSLEHKLGEKMFNYIYLVIRLIGDVL